MSNSKKTREAEQRLQIAEQQTKQAQANAETARISAAAQAQEKVKITPQAETALTRAGNQLSAIDAGDYSKLPGVLNFMLDVSGRRSAAMRASPTGSASLAFDVANPNLLAMNQQRIDAESANQTAAGVDLIARDTERNAVQDIANFSGMDLSAKTGAVNFMFQNAGLAGNAADRAAGGSERAMSNYINERNRRGFWESMALSAVGAAGQAAGAYFGKGK